MNFSELANLSIERAGAALQKGEMSPLELTDAYLARIEQFNPRINAYITVTAERAREDAKRATEELAAGKFRGPLHGIPIAHKDLYETAGIRTTGGAKIHANHIPRDDCTVATRLRAAGTILLGKLNTHEYAYGVTTDNPHFGPTRNPWDPQRIPAGSSGGSGAAIAAGLATAATGTDTGGSIRMPASVCGVVGLKPTYGRVSKQGVLPLSYLFDHTGPLTRTVMDAGLMFNVMAGYDPADPASLRLPNEDVLSGIDGGIRGLRIGVPRGYFFAQLEEDVATVVEEALAELGRLGARVREVDIPGVPEGVGGLFGHVLAEAQEIHAHALRTRGQDFGPDLQALLGSPAPDTAALMAGLRACDALTAATRQVLEEVDVLVTPTTPITAVPIGQESVSYGGVEEPVLMAMIRCTAPFNASHLPALSLPCGFSRAGRPVGLQIVGRPFDERLVLRVGHAYERSMDWHLRSPDL